MDYRERVKKMVWNPKFSKQEVRFYITALWDETHISYEEQQELLTYMWKEANKANLMGARDD